MSRAQNLPGHRALRRGRCSLAGRVYHVTTTTLARKPIFGEFDRACAAAAAITSRESILDAHLFAWVLMPDHLHLLIQLGTQASLPILVCRLKARSNKVVKRATGWQGEVWAKGYHDRALRREDDLQAVARYIVANPVRAGLAQRCTDYPFWDAVWLSQSPACRSPL